MTAIATPTVQFKEALLELKVTPTITNDGRVFLDMGVKKDELDIYDISIERITKQYIAYIDTFQMLNIEC